MRIGSPDDEPERIAGREKLHQRFVGRTFAISSKEVTQTQFEKLIGAGRVISNDPSEDLDSPRSALWFEAARYCNLLSKAEGIPENQWCYVPKRGQKFEQGMELAPDYLTRTGYRLPTEAEWEFACRSGTSTARYYGWSEALLARYGWYYDSSSDHLWPVGRLKPNDFGLFDMLGNVHEWCQDQFWDHPPQADKDTEGPLVVSDDAQRVVRGGGFTTRAKSLRSARRDPLPPTTWAVKLGFRVARTLPRR